MTPNTWFAVVAAVTFALMMTFPLALWRRCGSDAQRLLKNDPSFGFFTLFVFPLAMGTLAKILAIELPTSHFKAQLGLLLVFAMFLSFAALLAHGDIKISPLDPYMLREDDALLHERTLRRQLHELYRELHMGDLADDQKKSAVARIRELQRAANIRYAELAGGFQTWRDFWNRSARVAKTKLFVNSIVGVGCAALFSWLILAGYRALATDTSAATADATMVCVGLLLLWFPLRLYSEWYIGFYTFRPLRQYWTFWFLALAAIVSVLLMAIILSPGTLSIAFSSFGAALLVVFGAMARLKPELMGYAAVVFEEMPTIPYIVAIALGLFLVIFTIVIAVVSKV